MKTLELPKYISRRLPIGMLGSTTGQLVFVDNDGREISIPGGVSVVVTGNEFEAEPGVWIHSISVLALDGSHTALGYDGAHESDIVEAEDTTATINGEPE